MVYRFVLPDLGEGIAEGQLVEWLVQPGQTIVADEPIAEVTTDKVDVVIPSPVAGVVAALCVDAGGVVPVGTVLAEIATEGEAPGLARGASPSVDSASVASPSVASPSAATPAVIELAERLDVDLATIPATSGRVTASDVRAAARDRGSATRAGRATIARRLTEAAAVPVVTNVDEVDFEAVRAAGVAPLTAVARAAVVALGDHPALNAWGDADGSCLEQSCVHLGIATQTPNGLAVPVVRDAHLLPTPELGQAVAAVTAAAREGRARPEDFRGSTFTISSAGRLSGIFATPLLNLPEVAILGLYRVEQRAVVRDGAVVARHTAHLSVSFDHRAVDGAAVAMFLARVGELIADWPAGSASAERAAES